MADSSAIPTLKADKSIDLKYQPGFSQIAWLCIVVLYAPIAVLVLFSFNENRSVTVWTQFSLDWYVKAINNDGIRHAAWVSLEVAFIAMVLSTIMATMAALVTTRTANYRGMNLAVAVINQPLMVPEVVTAVATLTAIIALIANFHWIEQAPGGPSSGSKPSVELGERLPLPKLIT